MDHRFSHRGASLRSLDKLTIRKKLKILKTANMTQNSWEKLEPMKTEALATYTANIPMINIKETLLNPKKEGH